MGDDCINSLLLSTVLLLRTKSSLSIVELQWLEHFWNHKNMFQTGLVRANEC